MSFWEKKMRGEQEARPRPSLPPMPNPTPVQQRYSTPPTQPRIPAAEIATDHSHADRQGVRVAKLSHCPECGSANYGGAVGTQMKRCFDCNYGGAYRNPSQGLPVAQTEGPTKAATQVETGGYNPQQVIGRV